MIGSEVNVLRDDTIWVATATAKPSSVMTRSGDEAMPRGGMPEIRRQAMGSSGPMTM